MHFLVIAQIKLQLSQSKHKRVVTTNSNNPIYYSEIIICYNERLYWLWKMFH